MQTFKVGDKVQVVDEEKMLDHFVPEEAIRVGTVSVVCAEESAVKLLEDSAKWWYPANCLALVE